MIYLDHNATTRPTPAVAEAMSRALSEFWANPSSVHRAGQAARAQVELARKEAAELLHVSPREVTFTSGGTEAIDLGVRGILDGPTLRGGRIVISSKVEHAAVRELLEDFEKRGVAQVRWAPIDQNGVVSTEALAPLLKDATLAVFQWANNETGVIQPVDRIAALCRERRVPFLCDASQWIGKEATTGAPPCDLLVASPHKFYGPKGVGILWVRAGVGLAPTIHGAQELGRRGGTENVPGIVGAGVACRQAREWLARGPTSTALRDRFERLVLEGVSDAVVNSAGGGRIWNTSNIGFPALEAEALLLMLSEKGVCASAGAACSSGSLEPSPVLLAMGIPDRIAHGSLRFSLGRETTQAEIDAAATLVIECVGRLR